jgi:hypothetical protein
LAVHLDGLLRLLFLLISLSITFTACRKDAAPADNSCIPQQGNPHLRSYAVDSVTANVPTAKHCGLLPLASSYQWIYLDSIYTNGSLSAVLKDTLQFTQVRKTPDGLTWWIPGKYIGLPANLYSNDSSVFLMEKRLFAMPEIWDAKREFHVFAADSVRYLTSFGDVGAIGKAVKSSTPLQTGAGSFSGCILFEKNSPGYRKEKIWLHPGTGVIRFVHEQAAPGSSVLQLRRVSTLVSYRFN